MSIPGAYGPIGASEGDGYAAQQQVLPNYPTGVGAYGFYSKTVNAGAFGVYGAIEAAKIAGYGTNSGWYHSELGALGVEIGNHDTYVGGFVGKEFSKDGCETIILGEGQYGLGIPGVAGGAAGLGGYWVPKSGETGAFVYATPRILNEHFAFGVGISLDWKY